MLEELRGAEKVIGAKQSRRAVRDALAQQVYLACDADPALTDPIAEQCSDAGVSVFREFTMKELGQACGIEVGASAAAVLAD